MSTSPRVCSCQALGFAPRRWSTTRVNSTTAGWYRRKCGKRSALCTSVSGAACSWSPWRTEKQPSIQVGKVGAWAATLDEVAREHNVLIVVSAGNRYPRGDGHLEEAVTEEYPRYLLERENRLLEPAGAINVITVGSLAHTAKASSTGRWGSTSMCVRSRRRGSLLHSRASARSIGRGAIKPDVVEVGGTMVFDPPTMALKGGDKLASAGVLTLHHRPTERLFESGSRARRTQRLSSP